MITILGTDSNYMRNVHQIVRFYFIFQRDRQTSSKCSIGVEIIHVKDFSNKVSRKGNCFHSRRTQHPLKAAHTLHPCTTRAPGMCTNTKTPFLSSIPSASPHHQQRHSLLRSTLCCFSQQFNLQRKDDEI